MAAFPPARWIAEFSDHVIATDLPALPPARRADVVAFAGRRIDGLPSPMKIGVGVVAVVVGGLGRIVGMRKLTGMLTRHPLPVFGDYVRLVRSLSFAYVWETWPSTAADGSPVD